MLQTPRATRGMVVAPHHLAAQAGLRVLREGGNAIEAMVAAAATIAVVYPHMNSLGGDNFWLISDGDAQPLGIDACGAAAGAADVAFYRQQGYDEIPPRGALAANTRTGARRTFPVEHARPAARGVRTGRAGSPGRRDLGHRSRVHLLPVLSAAPLHVVKERIAVAPPGTLG